MSAEPAVRRRCSMCKENLPESRFGLWFRQGRALLQSRCRPCRAKYRREHLDPTATRWAGHAHGPIGERYVEEPVVRIDPWALGALATDYGDVALGAL